MISGVRSRLQTYVAYLLAPILTLGTTTFLVALQNMSENPATAGLNHLYVTGYVIPIVIATLLGGRLCGAITLLYTSPSSVYYLMAPRYTWKFGSPWYWAEIVFEDLAGLIIIFGLDAQVRNSALLKQAQERADREALINRVSTALRGSTDPDLATAAALAALGEALHADRCYFALSDDDDDLIAVRHDWRKPGLESIAGDYKLVDFECGLSEIFHAGQSLAVRDIRERPFSSQTITRMLDRGLISAISVPLHHDGKLVAALIVAMAATPRDWTTDEVAVVELIAAQVRGAVEAARLRQREHNIATALQEALQPEQPPLVPGLEIAMHYRAALAEASVGGDFYDIFSLDKGVTCLVIGDLSGKGLEAASQIATVRNMLRYAVYHASDLAASIMELNDTLIEHSLLPGFATLFVGAFDNSALTLTYVSCGHEPGLMYRHATGRIEEFNPTGPAIGVVTGAAYTSHVVPLMRSDMILIFTDGVTEAGVGTDDFLGVQGLAKHFREHPAGESLDSTIDRLVRQVYQRSGGHLRDDICLMLMRVNPGTIGDHSARQRITFSRGQIRTDEARAIFYREVLQAATGGRLTICDKEELHGMVAGAPNLQCPLESYEDVGYLRRMLLECIEHTSMSAGRVADVCICVTEAAANAVKHGGRGFAEIWCTDDDVSVLISDNGPGISAADLARATLDSGYSNFESLGLGFTMMMETADSIALSTSEAGTKLMLRVGATNRLSLADKLLGDS